MRILGIVGSLRAGSHNRRLLAAAAAAAPFGVSIEVYERLGEIPPYNEDLDAPEPVLAFRAAIADADAVLIATPEYNASIPGVLKNALDWASRPFPDNALRGKPTAVVGASTGLFGAVWAQAELRKVLATIGADVVDTELPVGQADQAFDEHGRLREPATQAALVALLTELGATGDRRIA
ncbi:MAG: NAD(P)H-dependent oxidoreductase [Pseudonocardia sp.]|nr:NAD(P)H-dependent oxidoreductase [Pseudonocardia sp.]